MGVDLEFFGHKADNNIIRSPLGVINNCHLGGGAKWLRDLVWEHVQIDFCVPGGDVQPTLIAKIADKLRLAALYKPQEERLLLAALIFQVAKERCWRAEVSF